MNAKDQLITRVGRIKEWWSRYSIVRGATSYNYGTSGVQDSEGNELGVNQYQLEGGTIIDIGWTQSDQSNYEELGAIVQSTIELAASVKDSRDVELYRLINKVDNVIATIQFYIFYKVGQYFPEVKARWFYDTLWKDVETI